MPFPQKVSKLDRIGKVRCTTKKGPARSNSGGAFLSQFLRLLRSS